VPAFRDEFVLRKSLVFKCIAHCFSDRLLGSYSYVETSAKEGSGIEELKAEISKAIV